MVCLTVVASIVTTTAQGTFIANNNYVPSGATDKAFVIGLNGLPASVYSTAIQFTYKPNPELVEKISGGKIKAEDVVEDILPISNANFVHQPLTFDGLFFFGIFNLPLTKPGDTAQIVIRAWDKGSGFSYEDASIRDSAVVTINNLGGGIMPPATLALNSDFRGLDFRNSFIPEPSTYALMALGLVGVFFINKRK